MKRIILTVLLATMVGNAFADNFQILYREGNSSYAVTYSPFRILDANNGEVTSGYTDKYGRIIANLRAGTYTCVITYRNKEYRSTITIDGSANVKDVLLP